MSIHESDNTRIDLEVCLGLKITSHAFNRERLIEWIESRLKNAGEYQTPMTQSIVTGLTHTILDENEKKRLRDLQKCQR